VQLSKFYLSAYLDSLKDFGWSLFLVKGNFPKEFPITSSEASNGFGLDQIDKAFMYQFKLMIKLLSTSMAKFIKFSSIDMTILIKLIHWHG